MMETIKAQSAKTKGMKKSIGGVGWGGGGKLLSLVEGGGGTIYDIICNTIRIIYLMKEIEYKRF